MTQKDFRALALNVMILFIYTLAMYNNVMLVIAGILTALLFLVCIVDVTCSDPVVTLDSYDSNIVKYTIYLINIAIVGVLLFHQSYTLAAIVVFMLLYVNIKISLQP